MSENKKKRHLHTTISEHTFEMIDILAQKYGSKQSVIEEAVKQLQIKDHQVENIKKQNLDIYQLWHLMRDDFKMMAVGRRTFLSYIADIPQEPIHNNNAIEIIEWYYNNMQISDLNLYQILEAIKNLWIAGNYFRKVDIKIPKDTEPLKANKFQMIFSHDFDNLQYGKYWSQYFKFILEHELIGAKVKYQTRNQSFYMEIEK